VDMRREHHGQERIALVPSVEPDFITEQARGDADTRPFVS